MACEDCGTLSEELENAKSEIADLEGKIENLECAIEQAADILNKYT